MKEGASRLVILVAAAGVLVAAVVAVAQALRVTDPLNHHVYTAPRAKTGTGSSPGPPPLRLRGGGPAHVAIVIMENKEYGDVIGSGQARFITSLAHQYALAGRMYGTRHPSLPNYLALTGGSTFGVSSDCQGCAVRATNLATQLQSAGVSWKAYMEDLPHPCYAGTSAADYAKKHDPFIYYIDVARSPSLCRHIVPFSQLAADERAGTLPRFIWITPNLCHDMHDCSVSTGDRFLAGMVPRLLSSLGANGLLFLTWDEGSSDLGCCGAARGGHIVTIVAGPGARRGVRLSSPTDHYSVLQAVEDLLGLPRLRWAACGCTPSLRPLVVSRS